MAALSSHLMALCVPELSGGTSHLAQGGLGGGEGVRCGRVGGGAREAQGWAKGRKAAVGVRASGVFNGGKSGSSKVAMRQVVASSGIAAPVVEDPADVDLVVDAPPKTEPLPSVTDYIRVMPDSLQYEAGKVGGISERTKDLESAIRAPTAVSYLTRILTAKVYDVAIESPLELAKKLNERLGVKMLLKREDMQPVGSRLRSAFLRPLWVSTVYSFSITGKTVQWYHGSSLVLGHSLLGMR